MPKENCMYTCIRFMITRIGSYQYSPTYITHVYSPRTGADKPLGPKVHVNRKPLSLCPFVASFKTISLKFDFRHVFFMFFPHVYSPGQGQTTNWGQNFDDNRKAFSLYPYVASFKMIFEI